MLPHLEFFPFSYIFFYFINLVVDILNIAKEWNATKEAAMPVNRGRKIGAVKWEGTNELLVYSTPIIRSYVTSVTIAICFGTRYCSNMYSESASSRWALSCIVIFFQTQNSTTLVCDHVLLAIVFVAPTLFFITTVGTNCLIR